MTPFHLGLQDSDSGFVTRLVGCAWVVSSFLAGCSGSDQTNPSAAGGTPSATGGAGVLAGGNSSAGGAVATGGSSGLGAGGLAVSGGASAIGGNVAMGGAATGGTKSAGGTTSAAGSPSTGGTRVTGGTTSSGGNVAAGGTLGTGGTFSASTGGSKATGGTVATGGTTTTGGTKNTGGTVATGGSKATGGSPATGGTVSTGGSKATGGAGVGGSTSTHTGVWKIMMLGDSITATTCYPQLVYQDLRTAGHTNFSFIGGIINNQSCGVSGLPSGGLRTEGHSGELVVTDTNNGSVLNWFKANPPDIVVMHFATNDVWGNPGQSTATNVLNAYTTVLANLRSVNANAIMFVAQIIPVNPSANGCSSANPCNYEATLDAGIPAWVTAHTTATSPVYAVDLENLFNNGYFANSTYTTDGVHPLLAGSQPMGTTMSAAMIAQVPSL